MATRQAIAGKRAAAVGRLDKGLEIVAAQLLSDEDEKPDIPKVGKHQEMLQAKQLEGMADWIWLIIEKMGWGSEERPEAVSEAPAQPYFEPLAYADLPITTLVGIARQRGIALKASATKDDVVAALKHVDLQQAGVIAEAAPVDDPPSSKKKR